MLNSLPTSGQTSQREVQIRNDVPSVSAPSETFAGLQRAGRDEAFAQALAAIVGDQGDTSDALDAQGVYFFEQFSEGTKGMFDALVEKGKELNRLAYEKRKGSAGAKPLVTPKPARGKRVYGKSINEFMMLIESDLGYASGPLAEDSLKITETETETSKTSTAGDVKVIDMPDATVTNTHAGETKLSYDKDEMSMTTSTTLSQKAETVSKTGKGKANKTQKIEYSTTFGWCPDAEGKVRGKTRARIFNQTSIIKGTQIAASTTEYTMEFHLVGYVNDDAEMTHFDEEGVISEKITGYDRAVDMGFIQPKPGFKDGSASIVYNIGNSSPPSEGKDIVLGPAKAKTFALETPEQVDRVLNFVQWGVGMTLIELNLLMKTAISRWQNGECVAVDCKVLKTSLKPNEMIDITTVSVSKHDNGKIDARMNGSGTESVTPEEQQGKPSAVYKLTAPSKGEALFIVQSVSKRGTGSELIRFTEEKKATKPPVKSPPVKQPKCDDGWTGTIKAVNVKKENKQKGQDGRMVRQVDAKSETFDVKVTVIGTRDTSYGILNNFHGNAESGFLKTTYTESNYAPGKMSCDKSIITSHQTIKMEIQDKGEANGKILVAIAAIGTRGHISFTAPEVAAERIIIRTYDTACASYNAVNSSTDRSSSLIAISAPMFEVDFDIDSSYPNVLKGSKTVQNSDGSETIYTWDLSQCK